MDSPDRLAKLRHDLSNPLGAILAEAQLLLLDEDRLSPATAASIRTIEALSLRMRALLREEG